MNVPTKFEVTRMKVPTDLEVTHATKIEVTRMEVPTNHQLIGRNGKNLNRKLSPLLGRKRVILTIRVSVCNVRVRLTYLRIYQYLKGTKDLVLTYGGIREVLWDMWMQMERHKSTEEQYQGMYSW
jgi:hypothetical protein